MNIKQTIIKGGELINPFMIKQLLKSDPIINIFLQNRLN
jgi:hypothetical protein